MTATVDNQGQTIRAGLALLLGALSFVAFPLESLAAPCDSVPLCEPQVKSPIHYSGWGNSGWAYYCTGDHQYYWNNDQILGFGNNFTWDNSCFTVTENPFAEGEPSKMDATITNWCVVGEDITVTLGCSQQPQSGPACQNTKVVGDPGCPMKGGISNHCSVTNPPFCFQTFTEQCSDGSLVYCTDDLTVVWCIACQ